MADQHAVLKALRRRITSGRYPSQSRLPSERELADELGVSRGTLRKAMDVIESEGLVWRHVGKGTFVGHPSVRGPLAFEMPALTATPRELMEARLMLEPIIAARAANSATQADIEFITKCAVKADEAKSWDTFELWDRTLHRAIAAATQNSLCIAVLDMVNKTRENDDWSRKHLPALTSDIPKRTRAIHFSIVEAIASRNAGEAARHMRHHLEGVVEVYFGEDVDAE